VKITEFSDDYNVWLDSMVTGKQLLNRPDPGPTPWLVEGLIVDRSIIACVGRWKTTKSYLLLDIAISVVTGRPLFGKLNVPQPGDVIYVCEESGMAALHRRLAALCRGRAIDSDELSGLYLSPNLGVKLDEPKWQNTIIDACGRGNGTALIAFDPLARMKSPDRNENEQHGMAGAIEFMRELREHSEAAVAFVHHTGHTGEHMRGTSDLESIWETKLTWKRDGQSSLVTLASDHREAEAGEPIGYRIVWNGETRSMRFNLETDPLEEAVRDYLREHPDASANEVDENVEGTRKTILALVKSSRAGGSESPEPPPNHPSQAASEGGSPAPLFRGAGTTTEEPGSNGAEPPLSDEADEARWRALLEESP
jgi:hypothetical protein